MSDLRRRLENARIAALEGKKPTTAQPELPVARRTFEKQNAADAAVITPRGGSDVRSRFGQPRLPAPDPNEITITLGPNELLWERGVAEQQRINQQNALAREQRERAQAAERERQKLAAAAEAERLRKAGERFVEQTNELEIQDIIRTLTLAEHTEVERIVRTKYPSMIGDPGAWKLGVISYRESQADYPQARAQFAKTPLTVIEKYSDAELAEQLGCPSSFVRRLRTELR